MTNTNIESNCHQSCQIILWILSKVSPDIQFVQQISAEIERKQRINLKICIGGNTKVIKILNKLHNRIKESNIKQKNEIIKNIKKLNETLKVQQKKALKYQRNDNIFKNTTNQMIKYISSQQQQMPRRFICVQQRDIVQIFTQDNYILKLVCCILNQGKGSIFIKIIMKQDNRYLQEKMYIKSKQEKLQQKEKTIKNQLKKLLEQRIHPKIIIKCQNIMQEFINFQCDSKKSLVKVYFDLKQQRNSLFFVKLNNVRYFRPYVFDSINDVHNLQKQSAYNYIVKKFTNSRHIEIHKPKFRKEIQKIQYDKNKRFFLVQSQHQVPLIEQDLKKKLDLQMNTYSINSVSSLFPFLGLNKNNMGILCLYMQFINQNKDILTSFQDYQYQTAQNHKVKYRIEQLSKTIQIKKSDQQILKESVVQVEQQLSIKILNQNYKQILMVNQANTNKQCVNIRFENIQECLCISICFLNKKKSFFNGNNGKIEQRHIKFITKDLRI